MGAGARKINNARSQQEFGQGTEQYNALNTMAQQPFSPTEVSEMRNRAMSPIQAAYSRAGDEIARQGRLGGGYAPNATASIAKLTRDRTQQLEDATQGVNAGLAQQTFSNKLAARQGALGSIGAEQNTPKYEGFPWGKLISGLGSAGLSLMGAFKPSNPGISKNTDPYGPGGQWYGYPNGGTV